MSDIKDLERLYLETVNKDGWPDPLPIGELGPGPIKECHIVFSMLKAYYGLSPLHLGDIECYGNCIKKLRDVYHIDNFSAMDLFTDVMETLQAHRWLVKAEGSSARVMSIRYINPKVNLTDEEESDVFGDML